jgi:hypothetical protein
VILDELIDEPLIIYERGSTGRQHVLDAFHEQGLSARVSFETTSTETIVSMVEGGLWHRHRAADAGWRRHTRPSRGSPAAGWIDPADSLGCSSAAARTAVERGRPASGFHPFTLRAKSDSLTPDRFSRNRYSSLTPRRFHLR